MKREIWLFLFFLGLVLFSWPFLNIFRNRLSLYLYIVWIVFIGFIFFASVFSDREDGGA